MGLSREWGVRALCPDAARKDDADEIWNSPWLRLCLPRQSRFTPQGVIGGMQRGAAQGNYVAGPVGGVVGGAVGGAVGGVNGALGINPGPRYESRFGLLPLPLSPPSRVPPLLTGPERKQRAAPPLGLSFDVRLVVQNDIQQGTVDFNTVTVVVNEARVFEICS